MFTVATGLGRVILREYTSPMRYNACKANKVHGTLSEPYIGSQRALILVHIRWKYYRIY